MTWNLFILHQSVVRCERYILNNAPLAKLRGSRRRRDRFQCSAFVVDGGLDKSERTVFSWVGFALAVVSVYLDVFGQAVARIAAAARARPRAADCFYFPLRFEPREGEGEGTDDGRGRGRADARPMDGRMDDGAAPQEAAGRALPCLLTELQRCLKTVLWPLSLSLSVRGRRLRTAKGDGQFEERSLGGASSASVAVADRLTTC